MRGEKDFSTRDLPYRIRRAEEADAEKLVKVRLQIDGETENMDREHGEDYIDSLGFKELIKADEEAKHNLFLVAEVGSDIVGFSRCAGSHLQRMAHQIEFGVGVRRDFWGHGIGKNLLRESISWAEANKIVKMTLRVLETNSAAIQLYQKLGFEIEGVLKMDKLLSDGEFYDTILMARFNFA
ncbi:GNAT family N-acetyltransferase [Sediminibacillus halophilus]|uniref:Protein N-acetyltransferase, RimJ/RimL family n=1 Tax=Sediminibacillus halophilus TaxID=482461 RepID=A0A1G9S7P9_9BACI|nr:GNAT family N-acetyltransferase [Sediminibacillus halophilus]SDM30795.1 Protein N-acetyltransferase, RimJ/RimL family [Sediminibacillus halophilus]